ncbi:hypothetical protein BH23CHL6_BH23CHL6_01140 [soil metagenome]
MPEEGARDEPTGGAADQLPADIETQRAGADSSPPSEASGRPPPVGPRSAGPPADWLEKVRRHAPGLLRSPKQRALPAPMVPRHEPATGEGSAEVASTSVARPTEAGLPVPGDDEAVERLRVPTESAATDLTPEMAHAGPPAAGGGYADSSPDARADLPHAPSYSLPSPEVPGAVVEATAAEEVADQSGERRSPRAAATPPPLPDRTAERSRTVRPAYDPPSIVPLSASPTQYETPDELRPTRVLHDPWPLPQPVRPPSPTPDHWPVTLPATGAERGTGAAPPAGAAPLSLAAPPAPSVAPPTAEWHTLAHAPSSPADDSRWPTLPAVDPEEDAFEVATALRSRDRWTRLVREQESA